MDTIVFLSVIRIDLLLNQLLESLDLDLPKDTTQEKDKTLELKAHTLNHYLKQG